MSYVIRFYHKIDLPRSWEECEAITAARSPRWTGRLAHNTRLHPRSMGAWAVELHSTDVVTFYPDGRIELNSGGWQTATTRDRIRRCGVNIGTTYGVAVIDWHDRPWVFRDGMTLHPDGTVTYPDPQPEVTDGSEAIAARRRWLARLNRASKRAEARGDAEASSRIEWERMNASCESRQSSRWPGTGNAPYPGDGRR